MIRKILAWSSFVIFSTIVVVTFITATTYVQLIAAILLYPLFAYFAFRAFPRKARMRPLVKPVTRAQSPMILAEKIEAEKIEIAKNANLKISDIDKRLFLKLIGSTGLILFFFSIFNKNAGALFPGIAPGGSGLNLLNDTAGNKIDPAKSHPTDGYKISEVDDDVISFSGFVNKDNAWYIMRIDTETGSFRYAKGDSNFPGNWANRKNLRYDYYNNVFRY